MKERSVLKRTSLIGVALLLIVICVAVVKTSGQDDKGVVADQWEYLAVAGPSTANLSGTGAGRTKKEPDSAFGREAYVLEQHLDRLGANGWELIAVAGTPTDPAYYFKRRKHAESSH